MKLAELLQERARYIQKARDVVDKAEEEGRSLKSDERVKKDNYLDEADKLEERINDLKELQEREKREFEAQLDDEGREEKKDGYTQIYEKYIRRGFENLTRDETRKLREIRAQSVANATKGGYLVPEEWANTIIEKLPENNVMRMLATVDSTSVETNIPLSSSKPEFGWIDEEGTYPETDEEFGQKSVDAWKSGGIIKVSEELLLDNQYNLQGRISNNFSQAAGDIQEEAYINGNGVKKPRGILLDADAGVADAGGTAGFDADDVLDLIYSVKRGYRRNAKFLANDQTAKALRKLKDSNGQYIWQPSMQAGEPDSLAGYGIEYSPAMPDFEDNAKALLFGDIKYYNIFDRQGLFMQRLDEKYADTGQIGFRAYMRTDGLLTIAEAVKYLDIGSE